MTEKELYWYRRGKAEGLLEGQHLGIELLTKQKMIERQVVICVRGTNPEGFDGLSVKGDESGRMIIVQGDKVWDTKEAESDK